MWRGLAKTFGVPESCTSASYLIRTAYEKTFGEWEQRREGLLLAAATGDRLAAAAIGYKGSAMGVNAVASHQPPPQRPENQVQQVQDLQTTRSQEHVVLSFRLLS